MPAFPSAARLPGARKLLLLFLAFVFFLWRGPARPLRGTPIDLAAPYISAVRFLHGADPYSHQGFLAAWHRAGAPPNAKENASGERPIYPPNTLLLISPLGLLRWRSAVITYDVLCTTLYLWMLLLLARQIDAHRIAPAWNSWPRTLLIAFGLVLAPLMGGFAVGNLSVLAFVLAMFSLLLAQDEHDISAGILLALALCLKPTLAALALYYAFSRRWKALATCAAGYALLTTLALWRMHFLPAVWKLHFRENINFLFSANGAASFSSNALSRFDLLNLQLPFFALTHNATVANILAWSTVAAAFGVWMALVLRHREDARRWEAAASLLLLGLLPLYQRNYNAGFLLLAAMWALTHTAARLAKWILALCCLFLLPVEALLRALYPVLPPRLTASLIWNVVVMPQASWAILAIAILLIAALAQPRSSAPRGIELS